MKNFSPSTLLSHPSGWTNLPPTADGDYWMVCAKSWHSEYLYEDVAQIRLQGGIRTEMRDTPEESWEPAEWHSNERPCLAWNSGDQFEGMAAWKLVLPMETSEQARLGLQDFRVLDRWEETCPVCDVIGSGGDRKSAFRFNHYHAQLEKIHVSLSFSFCPRCEMDFDTELWLGPAKEIKDTIIEAASSPLLQQPPSTCVHKCSALRQPAPPRAGLPS